MSDVKTLQEAIEKKAIFRLNEDLSKIYKTIMALPLMQSTDSDLPKIYTRKDSGTEKGFVYSDTKPYWLFQPSSEYMKELYSYHLPKYIAEEVKNFVKEIDRLKDSVDELFNSKQDRD